MYFILIRLGIPQSDLTFIFIGRGSRTPLQVGLYKNFQNKMKPTRSTTGLTGLTGRPDWSDRSASELPELAVNTCLWTAAMRQNLHLPLPVWQCQLLSSCATLHRVQLSCSAALSQHWMYLLHPKINAILWSSMQINVWCEVTKYLLSFVGRIRTLSYPFCKKTPNTLIFYGSWVKVVIFVG